MELEISIGTEEGIEVVNPFEDGVPDDPQKLREIRELILSRRNVVNKLVSDDGTETWLVLSLLEYPEEEEWSQTTAIDPMFQVGEAAIPIVTDPKWESDLYTFKASGMPYTETEERDFFGKEAMTRVLSGFVVMIILLLAFLRSIRGVFVPVFTTIMGVIVVFGIMGWLGIGVDANMMTLPILLGMALSVGYSIHLVNAFKRFFNTSGKRKEAMISAVEETGWPLFFTAVTTIGSVMSFATAGILTIKWLGFTCAAVVLADYLFVIVLIPVLMSFGKDRPAVAENAPRRSIFGTALEGIGQVVLRRKGMILVVSTACILAIVPGIFRMSVNMDAFQFMGLKIPYIQRVYHIVTSQLGAYMTYNISIEYDDADAIKDPAVMKAFDDLVDTVGAFELTKKHKDTPAIFSILDILKDMNQTFHSDDAAYYRVPDERDLIAQLLFLYEISGGTQTFSWIGEDYSMLRAQVQITKFAANEIVKELNAIKAFGQERFPGANVSIVGDAVQFAELNRKIVVGELKSVFTALVVIGVLLIVVFGSVKTGLFGMLPNVAPLIVIGGYMGYMQSPLDMMTMTIMPMLLGIAVDDTIHFINHIKYEFERCGHYETAVLESFRTVGKTLAMTTIILAATFAMYLFSPAAALARIGLLAALGLFVALLADYLMTPALILLTKPFGQEAA
jgi:predicted RND superfamily exporter protein